MSRREALAIIERVGRTGRAEMERERGNVGIDGEKEGDAGGDGRCAVANLRTSLGLSGGVVAWHGGINVKHRAGCGGVVDWRAQELLTLGLCEALTSDHRRC